MALWSSYFLHGEGRFLLEGLRSLRFFRMIMSGGGMADWGEELYMRVRFASASSLREVLRHVGIDYEDVPDDASSPDPTMSYYPFWGVPTLTPSSPRLRFPRDVTLAGAPVSVGVNQVRKDGRAVKNVLQFHMADGWYVTRDTIEAARAVERLLVPVGHWVDDPPFEEPRCICPAYYPELFEPPVLRFFRKVRVFVGFGGHPEYADELHVALRVASEDDLVALLGQLGIEAVRVPDDAPSPVPGRAYTHEEYSAFPYRIDAFPGLKQPGHVRIAGAAAYAQVKNVPGAGLCLVLSLDDAMEVDLTTYLAAAAVEPLLEPLAHRMVDLPPDGA